MGSIPTDSVARILYVELPVVLLSCCKISMCYIFLISRQICKKREKNVDLVIMSV